MKGPTYIIPRNPEPITLKMPLIILLKLIYDHTDINTIRNTTGIKYLFSQAMYKKSIMKNQIDNH